MGKSTTIESFFKRKSTQNHEVGESSCVPASTKQLICDEQHQSKMSKVEKEEVDISGKTSSNLEISCRPT